jgi:hypothetical protein
LIATISKATDGKQHETTGNVVARDVNRLRRTHKKINMVTRTMFIFLSCFFGDFQRLMPDYKL